MSGYDGFSKSNNALDAENRGLSTAYAVAKHIGHGATAAGVKAVLKPSEWHHTSKMYNETDYFDFEVDVEEAAGEGRDLAAEIIEVSKIKPQIYRADVVYLEWTGSRKHPRSAKIEYKNIEVEENGDWYIFHLPTGKIKRKGILSTGTCVEKI